MPCFLSDGASFVLLQPASSSPEPYLTDVSSELSAETMRHRPQHINVILPLSMLTGLPMQLEATLNLLCDMAAEIVAHEKAIVCFWDESPEPMQARIPPRFSASPAAAPHGSKTPPLNLCAP